TSPQPTAIARSGCVSVSRRGRKPIAASTPTCARQMRTFMRSRKMAGVTVGTVLLGTVFALSAHQTPAVLAMDEKALHEYAGVYQWEPNAFVYLQLWEEFSGFGKPKLVAFDESGEVRTLY